MVVFDNSAVQEGICQQSIEAGTEEAGIETEETETEEAEIEETEETETEEMTNICTIILNFFERLLDFICICVLVVLAIMRSSTMVTITMIIFIGISTVIAWVYNNGINKQLHNIVSYFLIISYLLFVIAGVVYSLSKLNQDKINTINCYLKSIEIDNIIQLVTIFIIAPSLIMRSIAGIKKLKIDDNNLKIFLYIVMIVPILLTLSIYNLLIIEGIGSTGYSFVFCFCVLFIFRIMENIMTGYKSNKESDSKFFYEFIKFIILVFIILGIVFPFMSLLNKGLIIPNGVYMVLQLFFNVVVYSVVVVRPVVNRRLEDEKLQKSNEKLKALNEKIEKLKSKKDKQIEESKLMTEYEFEKSKFKKLKRPIIVKKIFEKLNSKELEKIKYSYTEYKNKKAEEESKTEEGIKIAEDKIENGIKELNNKNKKEEIEEGIKELNNKETETETEIKKLNKYKKYAEERKKLEEERIEKIEDRKEVIEKRIEVIEKRIEVIGKRKKLEEERKKLIEERRKLEKERKKLEEERKKLIEDIEEIRNKIKELEDEINELNK